MALAILMTLCHLAERHSVETGELSGGLRAGWVVVPLQRQEVEGGRHSHRVRLATFGRPDPTAEGRDWGTCGGKARARAPCSLARTLGIRALIW